MKISKKGVELCGKFRAFKRTPKKAILEHQKNIDSMLDNYQPILDESQDLQDELEAIDDQIRDINEVISILRIKDTTEEEYQKMLSLIDDRKGLRDERRELGKKIRQFTSTHLKDFKSVEDEIPYNLGVLASKMVDITAEEFVENYTDDDELMVRNLAFFKQMADAGQTDKQMMAVWQDIVKKDIDEKRGITPS
jgi:predicted  nucleic acid-binding Zn-ribbon protein